MPEGAQRQGLKVLGGYLGPSFTLNFEVPRRLCCTRPPGWGSGCECAGGLGSCALIQFFIFY